MARRILFVLFPGCEILDIAGPVQAFHEAELFGALYDVQYCGTTATVQTAQGLEMSALQPLPEVQANDWIMIPGFTPNKQSLPIALIDWLRSQAPTAEKICSVCTGSFLLAQAGLLDGRSCTTHWRRVQEFQERFPRIHVVANQLYIRDGKFISSAGIVAGIDMALNLIEEDAGAYVALSVAREMVVYMRREPEQPQVSVYMDIQSHTHDNIHRIQQYLSNAPLSSASLAELAALVHMSPRHLTREFRKATGMSIGDFKLRVRLEKAETLLNQSHLKLHDIATSCGFSNVRQLRRLWARHVGKPLRVGQNEANSCDLNTAH